MFHIELHNDFWLFVIIFMLHDFEEIITVENWSKKTKHLVKNTNSNLKLLI
ncbi:HXXEE domain-containing protein [Lysinibacillus xylanilyticus]|uniref:HXXEE domain-containing protein n=1 Tax=Lysinibacillus xylanilyticus TaxID=582475 RepID=UPI003D03678A